LDSSAFAKLFIREPGSEALETRLASVPDEGNAISIIAPLEVQSALQWRLRLGQLTPNAVQHAEADLQIATQNFTRYPVDTFTTDDVSTLIQRHSLRSLDALHLASCLGIRSQLHPGGALLFIASDQRLLAAAHTEGLDVWDPTVSHSQPPPVN